MSTESSSLREALIDNILELSFPRIMLFQKLEDPPVLGEDYAAILSGLDAKRFAMVQSWRAKISSQATERLFESYNSDGKAVDPEVRKSQLEQYDLARRVYGGLRHWYAAGLGQKELLANYKHWSASAYFDLKEAVLLSVGLEPLAVFDPLFTYGQRDRMGFSDEDRLPAEFLQKRFELFRREFDPNRFNERVQPKRLLKWVSGVSIDVHPGFPKMLLEMVERNGDVVAAAKPSTVQSTPEDRKPDARETAAMAKIFLAIAITEYGYVPDAKRSPVPAEIRDVIQRTGMNMSEDTIRKYLQMGRKYLPEDWKPGK